MRVTRINPADRSHITTLALTHKNYRLGNLSYNVIGTPCEGVTLGYACVIERAIQSTDAWLAQSGLEQAGIPEEMRPHSH